MAAKKKDEAPKMVRVRLRFGGGGLKRGDLLDVSPDEAARLAANGTAFPYSVDDEMDELRDAIWEPLPDID